MKNSSFDHHVHAVFLTFPCLDQFMRFWSGMPYFHRRCNHPERRCNLLDLSRSNRTSQTLLGTATGNLWHHKAQQLKQFGKELPSFLLVTSPFTLVGRLPTILFVELSDFFLIFGGFIVFYQSVITRFREILCFFLWCCHVNYIAMFLDLLKVLPKHDIRYSQHTDFPFSQQGFPRKSKPSHPAQPRSPGWQAASAKSCNAIPRAEPVHPRHRHRRHRRKWIDIDPHHF